MSLSACASATDRLATPEAARVVLPQAIGELDAPVADTAAAPALEDLIMRMDDGLGARTAPASLHGAIAFGAPFDCKPSHASAEAPGAAAPAKADGGAKSGGHGADELAKKSQNPVSNLISLPIEYNANFDQGARRNTQTIINVKPVIPVSISEDWNLINRLIVPLQDQPEQIPDTYSRSGLGDITYQGFFSPKEPTESGLIWGVGPTLVMPTATDDILGSDQWLAGPSIVGLTIKDKWVLGAVVSNVWTFAANDNDRPNVRLMNFQPIVNYNFGEGLYGVFSPIVLAKWSADKAGDVWTVPLGVGVGKVFKVGEQHIDLSLRPFYNVHRPDGGARWSIQIILKFLFPQG